MKLVEFNEQYQKINIHEIDNYILLLEVKMPSGEIESIVNPNVPEKVKYINEAYDENLRLKKFDIIHIVDFAFIKNDGQMDFGMALDQLKEGKKVARKGWNGKGIFIKLEHPKGDSKMTHPYIFIDTTGLKTDNKDALKDRVPWIASQTDMLAEDWIVIE